MWSGLVGKVNNGGRVGNVDLGYWGIVGTVHYVEKGDNVQNLNLEDCQEECLKNKKESN